MFTDKIKITKHSGIYTLKVRQELSTGMADAWNFFSSPANLARITPSHMGFHITCETPDRMYEGQVITYKIALFPGVKSNWITEITHVKNSSYFVDEQRFGPYRMWHHEHHFSESKDGITMTDKVSYKLPGGPFAGIIQAMIVKRQLLKIFSYRYQKLDQLFNKN